MDYITMLTGAIFLVGVLAITIYVASFVYDDGKELRKPALVVFTVCVVLCILGLSYSHSHAPTELSHLSQSLS
jgi:hypothetical protein